MRLYVNTNEVPSLKGALRKALAQSSLFVERSHLSALLERVELCEALQKSERRAKNTEKEN